MIKVYIIASPCSGKSVFVDRSKKQNDDYLFIDQDNITSNYVRTGRLDPAAPEHDKAHAILEYLSSQTRSSVLFGSYMPSNPRSYSEIKVLCLVLPTVQHRYFLLKRRTRNLYYSARSLIAKSNWRPYKRWNKWTEIRNHRKRVLDFARRNNLPVFDSIKQAVSSIQHVEPKQND